MKQYYLFKFVWRIKSLINTKNEHNSCQHFGNIYVYLWGSLQFYTLESGNHMLTKFLLLVRNILCSGVVYHHFVLTCERKLWSYHFCRLKCNAKKPLKKRSLGINIHAIKRPIRQ